MNVVSGAIKTVLFTQEFLSCTVSMYLQNLLQVARWKHQKARTMSKANKQDSIDIVWRGHVQKARSTYSLNLMPMFNDGKSDFDRCHCQSRSICQWPGNSEWGRKYLSLRIKMERGQKLKFRDKSMVNTACHALSWWIDGSSVVIVKTYYRKLNCSILSAPFHCQWIRV